MERAWFKLQNAKRKEEIIEMFHLSPILIKKWITDNNYDYVEAQNAVKEFLKWGSLILPEFRAQLPFDKLLLYEAYQIERDKIGFTHKKFANNFQLSDTTFNVWRNTADRRSDRIEKSISYFLKKGFPTIDPETLNLLNEFNATIARTGVAGNIVVRNLGFENLFTEWKLGILSTEDKELVDRIIKNYIEENESTKPISERSQKELDEYLSSEPSKIVVFLDTSSFGLKILNHPEILVVAFTNDPKKKIYNHFDYFVQGELNFVISYQIGRQIALNPNLGTAKRPFILLSTDNWDRIVEDQAKMMNRTLIVINQSDNLINNILKIKPS